MKRGETISASESGIFLLGGDMPVNRLGFGAMRLTGPGIWGNPKNPKEAHAILRRALEMGINFIDTADSYGPEVSENMIAEALYPYPSGLVIATKGGLTRQGPEGWAPVGRPEYLIQCVEMSLRRLKLDCIDLYQLHSIDSLVPFEDQIGALKFMQKQGKIRHIGLSNVDVKEIEKARKIIDIVSIQNLYNVANRRSEPVLKFCEDNNLGFIPWFPIGSGDLARAGGILDSITKLKQATPSQIAIAWLLKRSKVMLPIPGTSSMSHLEENTAAASIDLNESDMSKIG